MNKELIQAVKGHGHLEDSDLLDAASHGADSGYEGFTYYTDTVRFYNTYEALIWELVNTMADDMGQTPLQLIASFKCADSITDDSTFKNALTWFALEEAGRALEEQLENAKA